MRSLGFGAELFPLADGLGSVRARQTEAGAVAGTSSWDAWGYPRPQETSGTQGSAGWTGQRADPATGLVSLGARDYSPGTARFSQRDTLQPNAGGTQGYNPYWYANNNPVTLVDPTGHSAESPAMGDIVSPVAGVFDKVRALMRVLDTIPEPARSLVEAILGFAVGALRVLATMVAFAMLSTQMSMLGNTLIGAALLMIQPSRWAQALHKGIVDCTSEGGAGRACLKAATMGVVGQLPCVGTLMTVTKAVEDPNTTAFELGEVTGESFVDCFTLGMGVGAAAKAVHGGLSPKADPPSSPLFGRPGSEIKFNKSRLLNQMKQRGWTEAEVKATVERPSRTVAWMDTSHDKATGIRRTDAATGYYSSDGGYVVINDATGEVVQVSDRNDADWRAPWSLLED